MDLTKINDASDQLDEKNKKAILDVINLKVEDDMKDVLTKMDNMFAKIDSRFEHMESRISTVYWVIGLAVGLSTTLLGTLIALISIFKK